MRSYIYLNIKKEIVNEEIVQQEIESKETHN